MEKDTTIITSRRLGKPTAMIEQDICNIAVYGTSNKEQIKMLLEQQKHLKLIEDLTKQK